MFFNSVVKPWHLESDDYPQQSCSAAAVTPLLPKRQAWNRTRQMGQLAAVLGCLVLLIRLLDLLVQQLP